MRKVVSYMNEDERRTLLWAADLGVAVFSAGLAVQAVQFFINLILWLLAVIFAITIIGFIPFGVGFWGVGVLHAVLAVNNHRAEKRNQALINAMKGTRS